jgi:hypothetical protein
MQKAPAPALVAFASLAFTAWVFTTSDHIYAEQICTAIKESGKEFIGCARKGYEYTLAKSVNGIQRFSARKENEHNPRCYDINTNGVIAICTYRR